MAWTLRLNKNGTTTALIGTGNAYLTEEYVPVPPSQTLREILDAIATGRENELNVTETLEMAFRAANQATLDTNITVIKQLLADAELYATYRRGHPVYLEMQLDGTSTLWRTPILAGRLEYDANWHRTWVGSVVKARLHFERRYYWEHATEASLTLSSVTTSTPGTSGVTIQNHYVPTEYGNYAVAGSTSVGGVLPTPARLSIKNTSGGAIIYRNFYIANEVIANGATAFATMIQGEDEASSTGTVQTSQVGESDESNLSITITDWSESPAWTLSAAKLASAAGNVYRVFARFSWYTNTVGNTIFVTPQLTYSSGGANINAWQAETPLETVAQVELVDVGAISFGDNRTPAPMSLVLKIDSEADVDVEIDYIHPMPADNFRWLKYTGTGVANNEFIIDDGPEGRSYHLNGSSQQKEDVHPSGNPILLYPNFVNILYFLHDEGQQAPVENEHLIQVYYRPRRLTV